MPGFLKKALYFHISCYADEARLYFLIAENYLPAFLSSLIKVLYFHARDCKFNKIRIHPIVTEVEFASFTAMPSAPTLFTTIGILGSVIG